MPLTLITPTLMTMTPTMTMTPMAPTTKQKKAANDTDAHQFSIFPRASTTLITCASNLCKTWFLRQVMLNRQVFIEAGETIWRVVYINCNQKDVHFTHPWETKKADEENEEEEEVEEEKEEEENLIDLVAVGLHELAGST
jgi:hypothetical protein